MKKSFEFLLFILLVITDFSGCVKEDPSSDPDIEATEDPNVAHASRLPFITDTYVTIWAPNAVIAGFKINDDGGGPIIVHGVCWSISKYPTTADNCNDSEKQFSENNQYYIGGLNINTKYYLRAFAKNSYGKAYGEQISFTTPATVPPSTSVTDIDGNVYKTVEIGTQTWMAENLKTTKYNDGSPIYLGSGGPAGYTTWFDLGIGAYCWYDNDIKYKDTCGALYNWHAVSTGKLCPTGWHVPTYSDWITLITTLGGTVDPFSEMTDNAYIHWGGLDINILANGCGFAPVAAGILYGWGFIQGSSFWWTSTPYNKYNFPYAYIVSFDIISDEPQSYGYSVRCLKD